MDAGLTRYFSLFLSCFFIGVFSYPISMGIESRFDYLDMGVFGRIVNLTLLFFIFISMYAFHKKTGQSYFDKFLVIRSYYFGVFIVLLIGVWQLLSFYSSVPFPFETRSHVHSTYGGGYSFLQRLTSIAREPSFFVMLAVDFIGLSLLFYSGFKKTVMVALGLLMVVFSLAPSGFISLFGAVIGAWFFSGLKYFSGRMAFKKLVLSALAVVSAVAIFFMNEEIFQYIYSRIFDATPDNSDRFYMVVMPYLWSLDGSLFSLLFGYGVKSYSIIGSYYILPSGEAVHATSNNIYTDIFWESGLIGLVLLLSFFIFVFVSIFKGKIGRNYSFIAFYFLFDLVLSGFFRADYASARFFIILYLIYLIVNNPHRSSVGN